MDRRRTRRWHVALAAFAAGVMLAVLLLGSLNTVARAQAFSDIGGEEWFAEAVLALAADGIVYAREDGSFRPYDPVTRGELVAYLDRLLRLPGSLALPFTDVTAFDWYRGSVAAMHQAGLVSGTGPDTFSPAEVVTRQQAAAFVIRSLGRFLEDNPQVMVSAADLRTREAETPAWLAGFQDRALIAEQQRGFVATAYRLGLIQGTADGWFYPMLTLNRGQMAVMLYRAFRTPLTVAGEYPAEVPAVAAYPTQKRGSEGPLVLLLESRLTGLCYPCGDVDGIYDERTRDAVMAFEKVQGLPRDGIVGDAVWQAILSAQTPTPRLSAPGYRVEVDLKRQVLFMIDENRVWKIVHVSTGRLGTITGRHKVGVKQEGWIKCVTLEGKMYYPSYIVSRTAIHGYESVPPYPASHGCVRTPVWMAKELYFQLPAGTVVDVYY